MVQEVFRSFTASVTIGDKGKFVAQRNVCLPPMARGLSLSSSLVRAHRLRMLSNLRVGQEQIISPVTRIIFGINVTHTGYGLFHYLLMVVVGVSILATNTEMVDMSYVLSAAECDLGLSQADKGLLGAITYIGIVCSAHMWGVLADTTGRRRIMIRALLVNAAVSFNSASDRNRAIILAGILGACAALILPGGSSSRKSSSPPPGPRACARTHTPW
ncbi:hypothetical protein FOCC_FOCC017402 [Frankliniella occidentalis]|nr:hypothetical protein FOCC_FOCC017402 [Frankliniella occidentalis]